MKKLVAIALLGLISFASCKQETKSADAVKTITLTQTSGKFMTKSLNLNEGTYVFEIANKDVDHEVGFVLAPKGKTDQANHIKAAYVKAPVAVGNTSLTNEVTLTKGEYVYFCPLNPTPHYTLVVN